MLVLKVFQFKKFMVYKGYIIFCLIQFVLDITNCILKFECALFDKFKYVVFELIIIFVKSNFLNLSNVIDNIHNTLPKCILSFVKLVYSVAIFYCKLCKIFYFCGVRNKVSLKFAIPIIHFSIEIIIR